MISAGGDVDVMSAIMSRVLMDLWGMKIRLTDGNTNRQHNETKWKLTKEHYGILLHGQRIKAIMKKLRNSFNTCVICT